MCVCVRARDFCFHCVFNGNNPVPAALQMRTDPLGLAESFSFSFLKKVVFFLSNTHTHGGMFYFHSYVQKYLSFVLLRPLLHAVNFILRPHWHKQMCF